MRVAEGHSCDIGDLSQDDDFRVGNRESEAGQSNLTVG